MNRNVLALLILGIGGGMFATAQAPPAPAKIGVIQIQSALGATKEGQKAAGELEQKMAPRKKELEAKQNELKDLQERLQKGSSLLADAAKEDLTRSIDAKTKSYNRDIEDANAELEQEQQKLVGVLGQKMMQVIDKYSQANGLALVLDVSNQNTPVLYASNSIDITKEIIDLYDKTIFTPASAPASAKPMAPAAAPRTMATPPGAPKPPATAPAKKQ